MILITGATGHLGKLVIEELLKKNIPASEIAALVRDAKKATDLLDKGITLRIGDYYDYDSLLKALHGIETLLLVSSGSMENRTEQHVNAIKAAKANNVKHIVYTSMLNISAGTKFIPGIDHYETETYIREADIPYTLMRNTLYAEVILMLLGDAIQSGNWFYAAGDAKTNFAARTDMAAAIATVLSNPSKHAGKTYEIGATKTYSFTDIASILSSSTGKQITYTSISANMLKEGMKGAGIPDIYIPLMASMAEAIEAGEFNMTDNALEDLLGRKPVSLEEYIPSLLTQLN